MTLRDRDHEQIHRLMARYAQSMDFGDVESLVSCFAPDGTLEILGIPEEAPHAGAHTGHAAIRKIAELFREWMKGHCRHWNAMPVIEPTGGDSAEVRSYIVVLRAGMTPFAGVLLTGVYRDEVVRIDGRWVFARRRFRPDLQPEHTSEASDVLVAQFDDFVRRVVNPRAG